MPAKPARPWKPLSKARLAAIVADTEKDSPADTHTAAEVYDMGRELQEARATVRKLRVLAEANAGALRVFVAGVERFTKEVTGGDT